MRIRLAYGKSGLEIDLPDSLEPQIIVPAYVQGLSDPAHALSDALRKPIGSKPLRERVGPAGRIGIVVNDVTRATPYDVILPVLLEELGDIADDRVVVLVATGTHRSTTRDELCAMLGEEVVDRYRIVQNDANDRASHALVGTTQSGNAVWVHRAYLDCDLRILTGFIEPHFFAGFSGGGKACVPGLALLETTLRNHCPEHIDHPNATWGVTDGNPIWAEIQEAARMCGENFLLNVTMNRDKEITGVFAGDMSKAHAEGCRFVKDSAMVPVDAPCDIVVTTNSGYPLDLNLYQTVKGMSAAAQIVKTGGSVIVAAECWDGIPDHGLYGRLLAEAADPASLLESMRRADSLQQDTWQAQIHASICQKADVHLFTENLTDEQIKRAMLSPCRDIPETIDRIRRSHGGEVSIGILPEGPQTIPYIRS